VERGERELALLANIVHQDQTDNSKKKRSKKAHATT
jgi:hypothetical protein